MKIALIGSIVYPSPSPLNKVYAPLKLNYELAQYLHEQGHEVTLFARTIGPAPFSVQTLDFPLLEKVQEYSKKFFDAYETLFTTRAIQAAENQQFDVIHSHNMFWALPGVCATSLPVVITQHDSAGEQEYETLFAQYGGKNVFMVSPSWSLYERFAHIPWQGVVHHGVTVSSMPFVAKPDDYLAWVGRIVPSKGLHIAIDIAHRLNMKLKIVGPVGPFPNFPDSALYFEQQIKPHLGKPNIEYLGLLEAEETYRLLAHAKCLVYPSNGLESFGMVAIEALACGTPVVGTNFGPLNEIVIHGKTGFAFDSYAKLIEGVRRIEEIDREACRQHVQDNFSTQKMGEGYEAIYSQVIKAS